MQGKSVIVWISVVLCAGSVWAGRGPRSEIPRLATIEQTRIHVDKDHRSKVHFRGASLIQTPEGEVPKMKIFSYDRTETRLNFFKAWTLSDGKKIEVPATMIQMNPVSEESGFSNQINVEVAFPRMSQGATIEWEYEVEELSPPLHGFFSYLYRLDGDFHPAPGFKLRVESEIPLFTVINDPQKVLRITEKGNSVEVRLKRELINVVVNEPFGIQSLDRFPTVIVSTREKWDQVGAPLISRYEQRLAEPKTPLIDKIVAKARRARGTEARIAEVQRQIVNGLRYLGDWRNRFSGQVPRSLKEISESLFGDCKDLSLVAVRVLKELGYDAQLATIYSDRIPVPDFYYKMPVSYFNHQIVYIRDKKKEYWLDPTLSEDFRLIDDSLAGRMAVVWDQKPYLRKLPKHTDTESGLHYRLSLTPRANRQFSVDMDFETWGMESRFAQGDDTPGRSLLRLIHVFFPDAKASNQRLRAVAPQRDLPWATAHRGNGLFGRILDRAPMGEGFRLSSTQLLKVLLEANDTWVSDFDFGFPSTREYQIEFKNRHFLAGGEESCEVNSPWIRLSLRIENRPRSALLTYKENFRRAEIPNRDLRGKAFREIQEKISSCVVGRFLVIKDVEVGTPSRMAQPRETSKGSRTVASAATNPGMSISLKKSGSAVKPVKVHSKKMSDTKDPMSRRAPMQIPANKSSKNGPR